MKSLVLPPTSLETVLLVAISIAAGFLSSISFRTGEQVNGGSYIDIATIPNLFIAFFVNPAFGALLACVSQALIWKSTRRGWRWNLIINIVFEIGAVVLSATYFFRYFSQRLDPTLAAAVAISFSALLIFICQSAYSIARFHTIKGLFPDFKTFLIDLYLPIATFLVVACYIRYDFLITAVIMFQLVIGVALFTEWFMNTEKLIMSLQSELGGVMRFALREDVRQFPGVVEHAFMVSTIADAMARQDGQSAQKQRYLKVCGLMHETGTIETLKNPPKIGEYAKHDPKIMQRALQERVYGAPTTGGTILADMRSYAPVSDVIAAHRERPDGKGYPFKLVEEQIPADALLLGVANEFDVLTTIGIVDPETEPLDLFVSTKVKREPLSAQAAIAHLQQHAGTQYSKKYVELLETVMKHRNYKLFDRANAETIFNGHAQLAQEIQTRRLAQGPVSYLFIKLFGLPESAEDPATYYRFDGIDHAAQKPFQPRRQTVIAKLLADRLEQRSMKKQQKINKEIEELFMPNLNHPTEDEY